MRRLAESAFDGNTMWNLGRNLLFTSIALFVVFVIAVETSGSHGARFVEPVGRAISILFLAGGLVVWAYAIRFYARVHGGLGVVRSFVYLIILLCMNWISAFIFIAIEGRSRFFGDPEE